MAHPYRIGIAGLGTVGAALVRLLQSNRDLIAQRAGRPVEIAGLCARDALKDRGVDLSVYPWFEKPLDLVHNLSCDAIVELIGGEEDPARSLIEAALSQGRSVVTANKALLAHHGHALALKAEENNAALACEAAVAGGIPIIKTLREGLAANRIHSVLGILNGTCNYILSGMRETGRSFEAVLADAQAAGFAEADPHFDIDGIDSGHKLALLTALAFGVVPDFGRLRIQGIRHIKAIDIAFATELGYRIKLLGIARQTNGKILQIVEPCLVPEQSVPASVEGVFNAVLVETDFAGRDVSVGRGAGGNPTASAVVADIIDLARGAHVPLFGIPARTLAPAQWADAGALPSQFYLRLNVLDRSGVLADISAILRDHDVSVEILLQRGRDPDQPVHLVLITHEIRQSAIASACEAVAALSSVVESPCLLRITHV